MLANAKKMVTSLTEVAIALLALAIVASVLVGPDNMAFWAMWWAISQRWYSSLEARVWPG